MSFANIGKLVNAGSDVTKVGEVLKSFKTASLAGKALDKYTDFNRKTKKQLLTDNFNISYKEAGTYTQAARDISNISAAATDATKSTSKLKTGFKGLSASIKSFVGNHKLGVGVGLGIGAAVAIGTTAYTLYKNYKQNMIDTANAATEAWDNSLSDIQSKIQQFQELKIKLDSGDLSQSETIEVKQQILDLQNQIVATYGDQILSWCVNEPTIQELKIKNRSSGFKYPRYTHTTQRQLPVKNHPTATGEIEE